MMTESERITALRRQNEVQPEGVDSWGFPVGQFARELDYLRRTNASVYGATKRPIGATKRTVTR